MGIPKWIKIKGITEKLDPVNVVFEMPLEEVVRVLTSDGWGNTGSWQYDAELEGGGTPTLVLEKKIIWRLFRVHARLWLIYNGEVVIGNAHLDIPDIPEGHASDHNIGKNYISGVFALRGYCVEPIYLDNKTETHDGVVAKIYKCGRRCGYV
jgi:hypothetical protein